MNIDHTCNNDDWTYLCTQALSFSLDRIAANLAHFLPQCKILLPKTFATEGISWI